MRMRRTGKKGFTLVEIMVSMIVLALLASGFFSILVSARYLVNRSTMRMTGLEIAQLRIEELKANIRADTWWLGGSPYQATGAWSTWAAYAPDPTFQTRTRVDAVGGFDCRKVSIQVQWNATKI
jgi:prepilin-type N-terminal cleavage/methylation domain-containing protein